MTLSLNRQTLTGAISKLLEKASEIVNPRPELGAVTDELAGLKLPAREDIGISFEHIASSGAHQSIGRFSGVPMTTPASPSYAVRVTFESPSLRGSVMMSESDARDLEWQLATQSLRLGRIEEIPAELLKRAQASDEL